MNSPPDKRNSNNGRRKPLSDKKVSAPEQKYRVEGLRRGRVMYLHVVGRPGSWHIYGPTGLRLDVKADTIDDVLQAARRQLPFRPIVVRLVEDPPTISAS